MSVDEFYCHRKRGLGRWERLGHPLDTFLFLVCFLWLFVCDANLLAMRVFVALSVLSCLVISKDEWEHAKQKCSGLENWLHALLFMLHPVVLISVGYMWWTRVPYAKDFLAASSVLVFSFLVYQTTAWNFPRRKP